MVPKISSTSCHFVLWQAVSRTKFCCSLKVKVFGLPKKIWLATLLLVTTVLSYRRPASFSRPVMFLSIKPFTQPALSYLMFNLPLTKTSQQRKTARHCRPPMKSSIVILILRSKKYYCNCTDMSVAQCFSILFIPSPPFHSRYVVFVPQAW